MDKSKKEKVRDREGDTANKMRRGTEIANGGHVDIKLIQGGNRSCQGMKSWKDKKGQHGTVLVS